MSNPFYALTDKRNIEESAQKQIENCFRLNDMVKMAIFPDIHAGKGYPVGIALATRHIIYPYIIGNDIGCGMAFFETEIPGHKFKRDKMDRKIESIDYGLDDSEFMEMFEHEDDGQKQIAKVFKSALGTIGGGNHFVEFMQIEEIFEKNYDEEFDADTQGIRKSIISDPKNVFMLVHSGSRGLGEMILRRYVDKHKSAGIDASNEDGVTYLKEHDQAVAWAQINRKIVAERFAKMCKFEKMPIFDTTHNILQQKEINGESLWIHHKGAICIDHDFAILPGSRGDYSYLVKVIKNPESLDAVAHGAGRKFQRGIMKHRLSEKYSTSDLKITKLGSLVICEDKDLIYEEAPEAYKKIDSVVDDLVRLNLVKVILKLKPLLTYKTR